MDKRFCGHLGVSDLFETQPKTQTAPDAVFSRQRRNSGSQNRII